MKSKLDGKYLVEINGIFSGFSSNFCEKMSRRITRADRNGGT